MRLFAVLLIAFAMFACSKGSSMPDAEPMEAVNDQFIFNVADYDDGQARYYSYDAGGKTIRFFLVKASDGITRAAFDACDVCYREKKGYVQNGDVMTCVNCGLEFSLDRINYVQGGCNPSPLAREFNGEQIVINKNDVIAGGMYF